LKWVNAVFLMNDNQTLPIEDAQRLSGELSEVLADADIIGLRAFGPNPPDVHIRKISQAIDKKNLRGALGMIEALQYGDRAVKNGEFHNTVLTSAWVHLGLLEHLDVLLDSAPDGECVPPIRWRRRGGGLRGAGITAGEAEQRAGAEGSHEDGFWRARHLRISQESNWSPCSVHRNFFLQYLSRL
jgi:hypothetical protein